MISRLYFSAKAQLLVKLALAVALISAMLVADAQAATPVVSEYNNWSGACTGSAQTNSFTLSPASYPITIIGATSAAKLSGTAGYFALVTGVSGGIAFGSIYSDDGRTIYHDFFLPAGTGIVIGSAPSLVANVTCDMGLNWNVTVVTYYTVP